MKYRIKITTYNSGKYDFTPQVRLPKNSRSFYLYTIPFYPIMLFMVISNVVERGLEALYIYEWKDISNSLDSYREAQKNISIYIDKQTKIKEIQEAEAAYKHSLKIKKTVYHKHP